MKYACKYKILYLLILSSSVDSKNVSWWG